MPQLNQHELEDFENELRQYRPRSVRALPLSSAFLGRISKGMLVAAVIVIAIAAEVWLGPKHGQQHHISVSSEPLTQIRAEAALARGASVDELAPLPLTSQQPNGLSALEVLSKE
jgi:hypothetical protein